MSFELPVGRFPWECVLCSPTDIWESHSLLFTILSVIENLGHAEEDAMWFCFCMSSQFPTDALPCYSHPNGKSQSDLPGSLWGPPLRQIDCCLKYRERFYFAGSVKYITLNYVVRRMFLLWDVTEIPPKTYRLLTRYILCEHYTQTLSDEEGCDGILTLSSAFLYRTSWNTGHVSRYILTLCHCCLSLTTTELLVWPLRPHSLWCLVAKTHKILELVEKILPRVSPRI